MGILNLFLCMMFMFFVAWLTYIDFNVLNVVKLIFLYGIIFINVGVSLLYKFFVFFLVIMLYKYFVFLNIFEMFGVGCFDECVVSFACNKFNGYVSIVVVVFVSVFVMNFVCIFFIGGDCLFFFLCFFIASLFVRTSNVVVSVALYALNVLNVVVLYGSICIIVVWYFC